MLLKSVVLYTCSFLLLALAACGGESSPSNGATAEGTNYGGAEVSFDVDERVFIIEPVDGAEVTSPLKVVMGVEGLIVRRRFEPQKRYGHHHILIDQTDVPACGVNIPIDDNHIHYHAIEKDVLVSLPDGQHTLTLLFGDAHDKPYQFHGRKMQEHATAVKRGVECTEDSLAPLTHTITVNVVGGKSVKFEEPQNEADIREFPFPIKIKAEGFEGETGHFVIQYGPRVPPLPGENTPVDEYHIHLEPGQTEMEFDLGPGGWPFNVFYVDANNVVTDPPISDSIRVTVWKAVQIEGRKGEVADGGAFKISGSGRTSSNKQEGKDTTIDYSSPSYPDQDKDKKGE